METRTIIRKLASIKLELLGFLFLDFVLLPVSYWPLPVGSFFEAVND